LPKAKLIREIQLIKKKGFSWLTHFYARNTPKVIDDQYYFVRISGQGSAKILLIPFKSKQLPALTQWMPCKRLTPIFISLKTWIDE
jgi:hypothetical protein